MKNLTKILSYIVYHNTVLVMLSNFRRIIKGIASWEPWLRHCKFSFKTHYMGLDLIKWLIISFLPRTKIPISVSSTYIGQLTTAYKCSPKKSDSSWERVYPCLDEHWGHEHEHVKGQRVPDSWEWQSLPWPESEL